MDELKKQFSEQVYELSFKGQMLGFTNALWTAFELLDHEVVDDKIVSKVKMLDGNKPNDLLAAVLPHVEILGITEVIPSMNDIFIKAVEPSSANVSADKDKEDV